MEKRFRRKSMSAPELQRLLGLGKTETYWLIKKGWFQSTCNDKSGRRIRIKLDSFEDWYANQFHYHKVVGNPPGANWTGTTLSVEEMADTLGITPSAAYSILAQRDIKTTVVAGQIRVYIDSFEEWYASQHFYRKTQEDNHPDKAFLDQTISTKEAAERLGIPRKNLYCRLQSAGVETVKLDGRIRIMKSSFEAYLQRLSEKTKKEE